MNPEADGLVRLAQGHLKTRQFEQAVAPLMKAAQLVPDSASIFADLGVACLFTRRLTEILSPGDREAFNRALQQLTARSADLVAEAGLENDDV